MHRIRNTYLITGFLAGIVLCSRPVQAQYSTDYQTNLISGVASNWPGSYIVGSNNLADALLIQNSGVLSNGNGYLGYEVGSANNGVVIANPGSAWSNRVNLYVGYSGAGNSLVISNGGLVRVISGYLGYNSGCSNNSVLVSDTGSIWKVPGSGYVGYSGAGNSLVIRNGGQVLGSLFGYLGYNLNSGSNTVLVTDTGSVWNCNSGTLTVGTFGLCNSLVISNGGGVYDATGYIGSNTTAMGNSAMVTGSGSVWSNTASLYVGLSGADNSLVVSNAAQLFNGGPGCIGYNSSSSNNSALISGTGSVWRLAIIYGANTSLTIGGSGMGNSLAINNGASVLSSYGYVGLNATASNNSVVVSDPGSIWSNSYALYVGNSGAGNSLVISNGGQAAVPALNYGLGCYLGYNPTSSNNSVRVTGPGSVWNDATNLYVGYSGAGNTLLVNKGAGLTSGATYVGYNASSTSNSMVVSDAATVWNNNGPLYVGYSGAGNSLVINNTTVQLYNNAIFEGYNASGSNNSITVTGAGLLSGGNLVLGYNGGANCSILVTGAGLLKSRNLYLGYNGGANDSMVISNGGKVVDEYSVVGYSGGKDQILVTDPGSVWSNRDGLVVHGWPFGGNSLVVSNGGQVVSPVCSIPGFSTSVLVTGPGSVLSAPSQLSFGAGYQGPPSSSLVISDGGLVVTPIGYLGYDTVSNSVLITGQGSVWNGGSLYVGLKSGANSLVISNHAQVYDDSGYIGYYSGYVGYNGFVPATENSVRVGDSGAWQNNILWVGYQGAGNLLEVGGGLVSVTNLVIGFASPADCSNNVLQLDSGTVVVTNASHNAALEVRYGTLILNGGTLQVDTLVITNACGLFVRNGGTLIFSNVVLDPNLSAVGDGIPNGWKQQHGLDPLDPNVANEDPDGDGMSNLQEYLAGTDPTNKASSFRITSVAQEGNSLRVTWMTGIGKTNALQATAGTAGGGYSTNGFTDIFTVTNTTASLTNYLDAGAATNFPSRFYRVRVVP